jgi:hypothetical protein
MLQTGLEFAPGTTEDSKQLVGRLFQPTEILSAYRRRSGEGQGRHQGEIKVVLFGRLRLET